MRLNIRGGLAALAAAGLVLCAGCTNSPTRIEYLAPEQVADLTMPEMAVQLPVALRDQPVHIASVEGVGTLVGGQGGLYQLVAGTFHLVDENPVVGLTGAQGLIVVAQTETLQVFDGSLAVSGIHNKLGTNRKLKAIAGQGNTLWIATETSLLQHDGTQLLTFDLPGVTEIATFASAPDVALKIDGAYHTLRKTSDEWQLQDFPAELTFSQLLPQTSPTMMARHDNSLMARREENGEGVWYPYRVIADQAELAIDSIRLDPTTGAVWALTANDLYRIDGNTAWRVSRPASLQGSIASSHVTLQGGMLFLSDGARIVRLGEESPVTYTEDIAPFFEDNCARCHTGNAGPGSTLDSYELLKEKAAESVTFVEADEMPLDSIKNPLIGDKGLLRRWVEGGLRQ